jgi:hypothetical protein
VHPFVLAAVAAAGEEGGTAEWPAASAVAVAASETVETAAARLPKGRRISVL